MRLWSEEEVREMAEKVHEMGPVEGRAFLMTIEDLHCFTSGILGYHDMLLKEGKHYLTQSAEE